ncbi:hypothetical protein DFR35_1237 [Sulfurisoma sediminicola]|uniref:Uncharacterized protein n=1 Tax=Sulfurisoma sediminicola TaxID=1381557 RepID=A0A497XD54_9PROT|nr:hypothetical protein DFR35_1237 [Sulfurisoma sediminicola]
MRATPARSSPAGAYPWSLPPVIPGRLQRAAPASAPRGGATTGLSPARWNSGSPLARTACAAPWVAPLNRLRRFAPRGAQVARSAGRRPPSRCLAADAHATAALGPRKAGLAEGVCLASLAPPPFGSAFGCRRRRFAAVGTHLYGGRAPLSRRRRPGAAPPTSTMPPGGGPVACRLPIVGWLPPPSPFRPRGRSRLRGGGETLPSVASPCPILARLWPASPSSLAGWLPLRCGRCAPFAAALHGLRFAAAIALACAIGGALRGPFDSCAHPQNHAGSCAGRRGFPVLCPPARGHFRPRLRRRPACPGPARAPSISPRRSALRIVSIRFFGTDCRCMRGRLRRAGMADRGQECDGVALGFASPP